MWLLSSSAPVLHEPSPPSIFVVTDLSPDSPFLFGHAQTRLVPERDHTPPHAVPIMTYLVDEYRADIAGYNVTASVHVEACWSGDPVNETKLVWPPTPGE